ncbi:MAG: ComEC family competence protein [Prevotellaceae bacterium]|jgi:competence protein ComEC|nr:ComEC family competence protein [Prevotellaceae bacterium]
MKTFLLRNPFFRPILALITGILIFYQFESSGAFIPLLIASMLCLATHWFCKKQSTLFKLRWLYGSGFFCFFTALGLYLAANNANRNRFEHLNERGIFTAKVISVPLEKPRSYAVQTQMLAFAADSIHFEKTQGNAILYLAKTSEAADLQIGDTLLLGCKFEPIPTTGNPEEFNYGDYLQRKGIASSCYLSALHWRRLAKTQSISLRQLAADCRARLLEVYKKQHIEGDEFAVLAALTLGYQDEIRDELYISYSNSGALHILSVSGLHVGIIYVVFAFLLSFLDKTARTRFFKSILIIVLLWLYAFITGLSPSVMRAALMFSLIAFGQAFSYKSQIYNTIFFSAFLLLLINPNYLFDVSFQLSYSAVLGIVFFQPRFKRLLHFKNKLLNWAWDLFCVSVAAQIATFPLGMFCFNKFSNHFLLTNYIAIPISTGIIYLAMLLFAVSAVPYLCDWIGTALKFLLRAQNDSIVFIDHLPHSTSHAWISLSDVLLLYAMVAFISVFILKKRTAFLFYALFSFLVFQSVVLYRHQRAAQCTELRVYSNKQCSTVDFIERGRHRIFTTDSLRAELIAGCYWLKMRLDKPVYIRDNAVSFAGKRILILTDEKYHRKATKGKLKLDYLIVGKNANITSHDIQELFDVNMLIVDSSFPSYRAKKLLSECRNAGIVCHHTIENASFVANFE